MIQMEGIKNLASAVLLRATKDYLSATKKGKNDKQRIILRDLNSDWCDLLTDGQSKIVAAKLESNPEAVKKNLANVAKALKEGMN